MRRTWGLRLNLGCIKQENFASSGSFFSGGEILSGCSALKQKLVREASMIDLLELFPIYTASVTIVYLVTPLAKTLLSRLLSLLWLPVQGRVLVLLPFQSDGYHCASENRQCRDGFAVGHDTF